MARLLFIGSGSPWLGGAGYLVRQNLFLGALAKVADLHLAMFDSKPGPVPEYVQQLTPLQTPKRAPSSRMKTMMGDLLDSQPRIMRGYDLTEPRNQVAQLNPAGFDAVFGFRIDFAHFAGVLNQPRLILDIDDPEHVRGLRRAQTIAGGGDARTLRDLEKLKAFEQRAVAGAKLAFVCQENDQLGWAKPPEVVPNCVEVLPSPLRNVTQPIVLFVGNCATGPSSPNVDAVLYFLDKIWPKILTAVPDAEFHLVGAASDLLIKAAQAKPRVILRGFVDNLAEIYSKSSVSIAPIRFGTGTRIKILEAFAHACPVVSTLAGAEGIQAIPGREIELAAGGVDFAARTIELLTKPELADQIGRGGHALALRHYDRDVQQLRLVQRFNEFLQEAPPVIQMGVG